MADGEGGEGSNPEFQDSELVLGLVAPVGTNFDTFCDQLKNILESYDYETNVVRLSDLCGVFKPTRLEQEVGPDATPEFRRIREAMMDGSSLRYKANRGDFLALVAVERIHQARPWEQQGTQATRRVLPKRVHVLRSLKHPDEVHALRRIYGPAFYPVGLIVGSDERRRYLRDRKGCQDSEINDLFKLDEHEEKRVYTRGDKNFGQRMRDTFHLADVFLPLGDEDQLERFVRLVFGCPFDTPTKDEHAMFMAFSSALRSADLSRQVGAVIVSEAGDVVATGANDVPTAGGGLYWPGPHDHRDHVWEQGCDSNEARRGEILDDVLERLRPESLEVAEWREKGLEKLRGAKLMDITEYGRAVHAEMDALLSCARSAVSPRGGVLYSTTFPCHNCAKHIVAAGLREVIYVEPYPKSQALELFADSIQLHDPRRDSCGEGGSKGALGPDTRPKAVLFRAFSGIGPKRFFDLFSMNLSWGTKLKRKQAGKKLDWNPSKAKVRVPLFPGTYIDREASAVQEVNALTEEENHDEDHSQHVDS